STKVTVTDPGIGGIMKAAELPAQKATPRISGVVRTLPRVTSNRLSDSMDDLRAQGKDILTLCGTPFWSPPEHVLQVAERASRDNVNSPSKGFFELREAIANRLESEGIVADPHSQILVTNGAMHALSLVFTTLLEPGDEVLMYRPGFFFFGPIKLAGGIPVYA